MAFPDLLAWCALNPTIVAAAFALLVLPIALSRRRRIPDVASRPFLTPNEAEFLVRLEAALPEMRVHAQVAMGALLRPRVPGGGSRRRRAAYASVRGRFDRKIVDYVIERRDDGSIAALVELDDRTHVAARDASRDAMTRRAGYRTIRWNSRRKPGRDRIRAAVLGTEAVQPGQR